MQAPFLKSLTIVTADGRVFYQLTASRTVLLSTPTDPPAAKPDRHDHDQRAQHDDGFADVASRTRTTIDPAGKQAIVAFDAVGRLVREETSNLAPRQYTYDTQGHLVKITEGEGTEARSTTLAYDAQGYIAGITDALGQTTSYSYDSVGRMLSQTLPTGHRSSYTYDAAGNRISSTDPAGLRASYGYDQQNRLVAVTLDPDGRAILQRVRLRPGRQSCRARRGRRQRPDERHNAL